MKNLLFAITAVLAVTAWGCGAADEGTSSSTTTAVVDHSDHVHYCAACGEEAGNDNCCSDEAEKCDGCGLNKGSALCCKGVEVKEGKICGACGLDYSFADSGDGPAVFVIMIVGFVVVGLVLFVELSFQPPIWLHLVLWLPLTVILAASVLRPLKGLMIALQFRHQAEEGRLDTPDEN